MPNSSSTPPRHRAAVLVVDIDHFSGSNDPDTGT